MSIYDKYIKRITEHQNPEADAKLAELRDQLWDNKISREDYEKETKKIVESYVPKKDKNIKLKDLIRSESGEPEKKKKKKSLRDRVTGANMAVEEEEEQMNPPRKPALSE